MARVAHRVPLGVISFGLAGVLIAWFYNKFVVLRR